jgi:PAS domain S-box-containing protein
MNAETKDDLARLKRIYAVINGINKAIITIQERDLLMQEICRVIVTEGRFLLAWIGVLVPEENRVQPLYFSGKEEGYLSQIRITSKKDMPESMGPTGRALQSGKHVICHDTATDPLFLPWREAALARGYRATISFPIFSENGQLYAAAIYAGQANFFANEEEVALILSISENIHFAMAKIAAHEKLVTANQQLLMLNTAVEHTAASVVITSIDGNIEYVNPAFCHLTGYSAEEVLGRNPRILQSGFTSKEEYTSMWAKLSSGNVWSGIFRNKKKNGDYYWEQATISPIKNAAGIITKYIAVKENITERRVIEERLNEEHNFFEQIFDQSITAKVLFDRSGQIIRINHKFKEMFEVDDQALLKTSYTIFDDVHCQNNGLAVLIQNIFDEKISVQQEMAVRFALPGQKRAASVWTKLLAYAIENKDGEVRSVMVEVEDMKALKEAQTRIESERFFFEQLFMQSQSALQILDSEGWTYRINSKFVKIFGITPEEIEAGKHNAFTEPLAIESGIASVVKTVIEQGIAIEKEFCLNLSIVKNKRGEHLGERKDSMWVLLKIFPMFDVEGKLLHVILEYDDISQRKKDEQNLLKLNNELRDLTNYLQDVREEERKEIAKEIHDELGQNLTVMKMDAIWIAQHLSSNETVISERAKNLLKVTDETVLKSRHLYNSLYPQMLNDSGLMDTLHWHAGNYQQITGIRIIVDGLIEESRLNAKSKLALYRAVQESLTNVLRYAKASQVGIELYEEAGMINLHIRDNGIGFDPDAVNKTMHHGLTGMVERFIALGGSCTINSAPGKGTHIAISVPALVNTAE